MYFPSLLKTPQKDICFLTEINSSLGGGEDEYGFENSLFQVCTGSVILTVTLVTGCNPKREREYSKVKVNAHWIFIQTLKILFFFVLGLEWFESFLQFFFKLQGLVHHCGDRRG